MLRSFCAVIWCIPFFADMHKSASDDGCNLLLEKTAEALNEEALQMLLVTTQHSNMMICIKYAVERWVMTIRHILDLE